MGQAFDRDGNVLGEEFGDTKREVFDKLMERHPDAEAIKIQSLRAKIEAAELDARIDAAFRDADKMPPAERTARLQRIRAHFDRLSQQPADGCGDENFRPGIDAVKAEKEKDF